MNVLAEMVALLDTAEGCAVKLEIAPIADRLRLRLAVRLPDGTVNEIAREVGRNELRLSTVDVLGLQFEIAMRGLQEHVVRRAQD